jgi:hypothetical protein
MTFSRGTREDILLLLPPEASTPVKCAAANFAQSISRRSSPGLLQTSPPRRRARGRTSSVLPTPAIRRSERLAKKSRQRASKPVVQAQNVLMKRLGITSKSPSAPPDASAFQRYLEAFTSTTLTPTQCEALDVLISESRPSFAAVVEELEP